ncbi:hypothetical protein [Tenacibaculum jejuense]|uniref:Glycosyl transferase family 28 C-terminal domain-containing protein n=1 Tax=Tenacibaculum jejuense TaxID=584609 RepID=A0A238UBM0_9FLAO|nr:hypothetical protein [Tenacibaculum jejuense]SNR16482.1 protein of unknown function [Tenacibaculum jejuense]
MYLFYVYGSGLGHLTRVRNFIHTKNIAFDKCVIVTNSSYKNYFPDTATIIFRENDFFKDSLKISSLLNNCIDKYSITTVFIDVFFAGFYGELNSFFKKAKGLKFVLLARILNQEYFSKCHSICFDTIYTLEKGITLEKYNYKHKEEIQLTPYPQKNNSLSIKIKKPYFLILHSAPLEEVLLLYKQALLYRKNEYIYIQTYINDFPVHFLEEKTTLITKEKTDLKLLKSAKKIFSGCGFNSTIETKEYRKKQHIIPFKRKYDDQFKRKDIITNQ